MWRYSESRTEAIRLTQGDSLQPGLDYDFPSMLPDGKTILATREAIGSPARTALIDFETGALIDTLSFPAYGVKYLSTGHLAGYVPGEGLVVVPFDLDEQRIVGDRQLVAPLSSATRFAVSPTGTLIYVPDADSENESVPMSIPLLAPFDGVPSPIGLPAGYYSEMRISPQEDRLAFFEESLDGAGRAVRSLKVFDLRRRTTTELIAPISIISELAWLPGGDSVAYFRTPFGTMNYELTGMPADGSGTEQRLTRFGRINCGAVTDLDVSPEGSFYVCGSPAGPNATRLFRIGRREGEFAQLTGRDRQGLDARDPRISPDGRFVAYTQNGRAVVGLSNGEGPARTLMSRGEARFVRWTGDSRGLLYVGIPPQGEVRMRTIDDDGVLASGENTDSTTNIIGQIDPRSPYFEPFGSGLAAIVPQIVEEPDSTGRFVSSVGEIKVVLGWFHELRSGSK